MVRWMRRRTDLSKAVVIALVGGLGSLVACTGSAAPDSPPGSTSSAGTASAATPSPSRTLPGSSRRCTLSAKLIPSCGVLWGIVASPHTTARIKQVESRVGRTFNLVYRFHDVEDTIPSALEKQSVAAGKILHLTIDSRDYSSTDTAAVSWTDVAAGNYDSSLTTEAKGIASLHVPVFVTFDHEANLSRRQQLGSPADFVAAWRHVHNLFGQAGASNAVWTWVMAGAADNLDRAAALWPGNSYVDWIGWDVYNGSGCSSNRIDPSKFRTFAESMGVFFSWLQHTGPTVGIDIRKPLMISEAASIVYPTAPNLTASWYAAIPSVLKAHPQVKAITLWDNQGSTSGCNYTFDSVPSVLSAVTAAGQEAPVANAMRVGNRPDR